MEPVSPRVKIGPIEFDPLTIEQAVAQVFDRIAQPQSRPLIISGANVHFVNMAERKPDFASVMARNDLNVADGAGIVLASRLLGRPIPERVTGIDLMISLCREAATQGRSVYLLGGMEGAAKGAAHALQTSFPGLKIVGIDRPPMGRESEPAIAETIRERVRNARPDFLFVCLGVPHQELWIHRYALDLPVRAVMGNGAAFDVLAGYFRRPPLWVQNLAFEWFYRLCAEPRRLWRRYLIGNLQFAVTVARTQAAYGGHLEY